MKKRSAPAGKLGFPTGALCCFLEALLPHLRHEAAHGLRCLILLLAGGVGVGPQGESRIVVAQRTRYLSYLPTDGDKAHSDDSLTRGEMALMLYTLLGAKDRANDRWTRFPDVDGSEYAQAVDYLASYAPYCTSLLNKLQRGFQLHHLMASQSIRTGRSADQYLSAGRDRRCNVLSTRTHYSSLIQAAYTPMIQCADIRCSSLRAISENKRRSDIDRRLKHDDLFLVRHRSHKFRTYRVNRAYYYM